MEKRCFEMITVNSLSGGKTSSYLAANYPANYDIFALVRTYDDFDDCDSGYCGL